MSQDPHPIPAEWLSAYYDGELDADRTGQVEAHLPGCLACQHALEELGLWSTLLGAEELPDQGATPAAEFWQKLEPQLAVQPPADVEIGPLLRRWLPGLSLLVVNGLVQLVGAGVALWLWLSPQLADGSNWVSALGNLVMGSVLGWPTWLLPAGLINVGVTLFFVTMSASLAVLYLAWLGYELRYGTQATARATTA